MTVRTQRDGPVAVITIDRPEVRNAVDPPTAAALFRAFAEAEADESVLALVLTGAGGVFLRRIRSQGGRRSAFRTNRPARTPGRPHGPLAPAHRPRDA